MPCWNSAARTCCVNGAPSTMSEGSSARSSGSTVVGSVARVDQPGQRTLSTPRTVSFWDAVVASGMRPPLTFAFFHQAFALSDSLNHNWVRSPERFVPREHSFHCVHEHQHLPLPVEALLCNFVAFGCLGNPLARHVHLMLLWSIARRRRVCPLIFLKPERRARSKTRRLKLSPPLIPSAILVFRVEKVSLGMEGMKEV